MPTPYFNLPLYTVSDTAALDTLLNGQSSALDTALLGNIWKFSYGARNEASYHLHHESLLSYLRFFARVEILMHRGRVPWRLRRRITGRLLAAITFNPTAERVVPADKDGGDD